MTPAFNSAVWAGVGVLHLGIEQSAARDDLFRRRLGGGLDHGYQALIAAVQRKRRIVITWCWELYFSLLCIVPADATDRLGRAIAADLFWLKPSCA